MNAVNPMTYVERYIVIACLVTFLSGCAAPLILVGAAVGFQGYKMVQLADGSEVGIKFGQSADTNDTPLKAVKKIGVWPSMPEMTMLAQKLEETNKFKVISPYSIKKSLKSIGIGDIDESMTDAERQGIYIKVASKIGVDCFITITPTGSSSTGNRFSLSKAETATHYSIEVYSPKTKNMMWKDTLDVVIKVGQTKPADQEVRKVAVNAVVEKLLELSGNSRRVSEYRDLKGHEES